MGLLTQTFTATLVVEYCCNCGVPFGLSRDMYKRLLENHEWFHCPNGHRQHYTGKSEAEKLKEQLMYAKNREESLQKRNESLHNQLTHQKWSNRALKAAKTRIMNRVKNGTCPCCRRNFQNLQNHFKTVHPELFTKIDEK